MGAAALRQRDLALAGRDVIEIGCGTGRNTPWLAERAASVLEPSRVSGRCAARTELLHSSIAPR
ncbi:hypothetical protein [Sorangium sp. So ce362]|uniref:hypothetical protein n=1 Tax=Sorangium sp. So ce362 TaxID=3133303 RepID=UPI003F636C13